MKVRLPEDTARIERSRTMTAAIREELRKKIADDTREQINQNAGRYDTILAYALSERFGFGRKRITDFLKEIVDCHIYTKERYGEKYQDSAYAVKLREKGIDMVEIENELDRYAKERGIEI